MILRQEWPPSRMDTGILTPRDAAATNAPPGLPGQPTDHGPCDEVGSVLLDEVAGAGDRHQGQIALDPVPGVVERTGEERLVLQAVDQEHGAFDRGNVLAVLPR